MERRDHDSTTSRRIFLAWMMALPVAGRAASQAGTPGADLVQKDWLDENVPPDDQTLERAWLDENVPPDDQTRERAWLDENVPPDQRKERCWRDENIPPEGARLERVWRDENIPPDGRKRLQQRCWVDEASTSPRR